MMSHEKRPFRVLDRRVSELNAKSGRPTRRHKFYYATIFKSRRFSPVQRGGGGGQFDRYAENYSLNKDNFNLLGSGNLHSTLEPATGRSIGIL